MFNLSQPTGNIDVKFCFLGKEYDVERFQISFLQPTDFYSQPQQEIRGGQLFLSLTQIVDAAIYEWGKNSTLKQSGKVSVITQNSNNPLDIEFEEACCISFVRTCNFVSGTKTELIISPKIVKLNGRPLENRWKL